MNRSTDPRGEVVISHSFPRHPCDPYPLSAPILLTTSPQNFRKMTMLPTNPMDLPTTQRLLEEHIAAGDITQADVDLLKRGYRSMATTTFLGSLVGIPVYIVMSRRRPPPSLLTRLVAASFMASTGSFLGFTIGGAAAAMEVSQHMEDSQRCVFGAFSFRFTHGNWC